MDISLLVFCARMTSTQRSGSMNRILKRNFVRERHDLHIFSSQVDRCIQTRKGIENAETMANEICDKRKHFKLDERFRITADFSFTLKNAVLFSMNKMR